jgi:hypothetical protein
LPGTDGFQVQASHELDVVGSPLEPTLHRSQQTFDRVAGVPGVRLHNLTWQSTHRVNVRMVDRLPGGPGIPRRDAAHVHPIAGGLGMNSGIQDFTPLHRAPVGSRPPRVAVADSLPAGCVSRPARLQPISSAAADGYRTRASWEAPRKPRPPKCAREHVMIWRMLLVVGCMVFFMVAAIVGASVWVLWDVLFPGRAQAGDSMSKEIDELLEVESRKG